MKTAMQELKSDLLLAIHTCHESLEEIKDLKQKAVKAQDYLEARKLKDEEERLQMKQYCKEQGFWKFFMGTNSTEFQYMTLPGFVVFPAETKTFVSF